MNALALLVTAGVLAAAPPNGPALSLEQALRTALQNHPELRRAQAGVGAANARADQLRAPLLPQVQANLSYQRSTANFVPRPGSLPRDLSSTGSRSSFDTFDYFSGSLSASQLVWDFGQTTGRWRASQAQAEAQKESARTSEQQVLLNVHTAFFTARAAKALVEVAQETLENQRQHLAQAEAFVQIGTRPEIDVAQARTDLANARVQLINAQNGYATAKAQLNLAMGVEGPADYQVSNDVLEVVEGEASTTDALLEEAIRARPELASLTRQQESQALTLRSIRGNYWPSLGVSTGLTEGAASIDRNAWNWSAGVNLSWPIFQGLQTRAQVREAEYGLFALDAQSDALRQQVRLEVERARLAVVAAKEELVAADEALSAARERLRLAEGRYETGVGNIIELGDAQVALTNAAAQRVQSEYRLASARAQLLNALGRPPQALAEAANTSDAP